MNLEGNLTSKQALKGVLAIRQGIDGKDGKDGEVIYGESIYSPAIITSASGEVITTTDSIKAKMQGFKLYGKSEQRQYDGNQLFDISVIERLSISKITEVTSNSISITMPSGYSGNGYTPLEITLKEICPSLVVGVEYVLNADVSSADMNNFFYLRGATDVSWEFGKSLIMTEELLNSMVSIYGTKTEGVGIISNIMVNKGSVLPWEPYVGGQPSPNPDYPQEIKCIGESGSVGVKVIETNVFDMESIISAYEKGESERETASGYFVVPIPLAPNTQYYLKANGVRQSTQVCIISKHKQVNASDRDAIGVSNNWNSEACITTDDDGLLYIGITTDVSVIREMLESALVQIEVGTEATEYKPYTEQPFTLTTPVPLTKWDKLVKRDGVWGWSIQAKEYNLTADTVQLQGNSSDDTKTRIYIANATAKKHSECYCNLIQHNYKTWIDNGYCGYWFNNSFCTAALNSWLEPYGYTYDESSNNNATNAIEAFKAMLEDKGGIQVWVDMQEEQSFHPLPEEEQTLLNNLIMNYPSTTIVNDEGAYMEVEYVADTKCYIDNKFKELAVALVSQ